MDGLTCLALSSQSSRFKLSSSLIVCRAYGWNWVRRGIRKWWNKTKTEDKKPTWISCRVLMMKLSLDEISLLSRSPCLLAMASVASKSSKSHSRLLSPFRSWEATQSETWLDPWQLSVQCWNNSRVRQRALQTSLEITRIQQLESKIKNWGEEEGSRLESQVQKWDKFPPFRLKGCRI